MPRNVAQPANSALWNSASPHAISIRRYLCDTLCHSFRLSRRHSTMVAFTFGSLISSGISPTIPRQYVDEVGCLTYGTDAANILFHVVLFHVVNERHRRAQHHDLHHEQDAEGVGAGPSRRRPWTGDHRPAARARPPHTVRRTLDPDRTACDRQTSVTDDGMPESPTRGAMPVPSPCTVLLRVTLLLMELPLWRVDVCRAYHGSSVPLRMSNGPRANRLEVPRQVVQV